MKTLIPLFLLVFAVNAHALQFKIERRVKNGFVASSTNPARSQSGREFRRGVRVGRPLYISDQTERYLKYQLDKIKKKLPVDFYKIREIKVVPTVFNDSSSDKPTTGRYLSRSNTMEVNYRYLFRGYEQKLLRVLVHEISHAYEEEVAHVSIMEKFLFLAGWHRKGVLFKWKSRRNFMNYRSPDPYEFTNTAEAFAVNMEYFLLDPQYQCRRPLLNNYLSLELLEIPFWDEDGTACTPMLTFPLNIGDKVGWWTMDPKKLYEVHYLLADEGSEAMSMFGHSMLRLVMCAPHRKEVSKECLKDIEYHRVLSYRANITDTYINTWKGLVGGYNSQLFVYPMVSIINEYTRDQFRNLISVPLELRLFEKKDFLYKMQEEVWAYRGRYQFITQNCATETLDFFKAFVDRMAFREQYSLTPRGVLDILHDFGMTYKPAMYSDNKEWKVQNTYLIESKKPSYQRFFDAIKRYSRWQDLEDYLTKSTASERANIIEDLTRQNADSSAYAGMYVLEKFINILRQRHIQNDIIKYAESSDGARELKEIIGNKLDYLRNQFPKEKLGYGIPTPEEFAKIKDYVNLKNSITGIDPKKIFSIVHERFGAKIEETKRGDQNEKRLKALTLSTDN